MNIKDKNKTLLKSYKDGNTEALDELIEANLGLVKSIAQRYINRGTDIEDLIQIGSIGLIKAANSFDLSLGFEFSTYAFTMVNGEIRRFLRDDGLIKVSRSTKKNCATLLCEKEKFVFENGFEPKIEYLAQKCNISIEEAVFCIGAMNPALSLNSTDDDDDCDIPLENKIGKDFTGDYIEKLALREAIKKLPEQEKILISLRYSASLTQSEVAKRLNTTQVKVSRSEKKILEKLKNMLT